MSIRNSFSRIFDIQLRIFAFYEINEAKIETRAMVTQSSTIIQTNCFKSRQNRSKIVPDRGTRKTFIKIHKVIKISQDQGQDHGNRVS